MAIEPQTGLDRTAENPREAIEEPAKQRRALPVSPLEDDINGELLEFSSQRRNMGSI